MEKAQAAPVEQEQKIEAFVLRDCVFGHASEVVTLSLEDAKAGAEHGMLDLHPAAIKAAKER
jgi:hypothetical protein